jgi:glycosyltransferase involved in cell wall biosynthesis
VRLHGVPIPTSIPRDRWYKTTVRVQHLAALTEERRATRYRKYQEVDPQRVFQASYEHLRAPRPIVRWTPRPPELPAVLNGTYAPEETDRTDDPLLSAVIISRDDGPLIEPTVASALAQKCPFPFEVIVVVSGSGGAGGIVRRRYPEARVIELDHPALPGAARNAGLSAARGRYITFHGSHVVIEAGSFANLVRAHGRGYAMVTGTMLNGTVTPAGWATYFLDNAGVLPGRPAGALKGPPIRCSYLRQALLSAGGFPEDMRAGEDTVMNLLLFGQGYGAFREPGYLLRHHSRCRTVGVLVRHHFQRGRAFGRILFNDAVTTGAGRELIRFLLAHPVIRTREVRHDVRRWGPEFMWRLRLVLPLVVIAASSAWAGLWYQVLRLSLTTLVSGVPAGPRPPGLPGGPRGPQEG